MVIAVVGPFPIKAVAAVVLVLLVA